MKIKTLEHKEARAQLTKKRVQTEKDKDRALLGFYNE